MDTNPSGPQSRRTVLTAMGATLGAIAVQAIARPLPAQAQGEAMLVGGEYTDATSATTLSNAANNNSAIRGISKKAGIGVEGLSAGFIGVYGLGAQRGVFGATSSAGGVGVRGEGGAGIGVDAASTSGTALRAESAFGYAVATKGRILPGMISGVATIAAGSVSVKVVVSVDVTTSSFVLLTPRNNLGGRDLWYTTDTTANSVTIHISKTRTSSTKVAWLLLG